MEKHIISFDADYNYKSGYIGTTRLYDRKRAMTGSGQERPKPSGCTSDRFRAEIGWMQWPLQAVARA
jgi:hypothetical protein